MPGGRREEPSGTPCELARVVERFAHAMEAADYQRAEHILETDLVSVWFGYPTGQFVQDLNTLMRQLPNPGVKIIGVHRVLTTSSEQDIHSGKVLEGLEITGPSREMFFLVIRMATLRARGQVKLAWDLAQEGLANVGMMPSVVDTTDGLSFHMTVQSGAVAMMAGEFRRAIALFMQAQLQVGVPKFAFLTRDVLIRTALIHASFGDPLAARGMLKRADQVPRTSSWVEEQLDAQHQLVNVMVETSPQAAWDALEQINLHQLGECWPFYIIAVGRVMRGGGYHHDLRRRLQDFDAMPLPRVDGQGIGGSILPVEQAMLALDAGQFEAAQELLNRADASLAITQLVMAAVHLHRGRPKRALKMAEAVREPLRGLRLLELRRLSVIATCHHQLEEDEACLSTVKQAMTLSRPLTQYEYRQFSRQVRSLAGEHIEQWDDDVTIPSLFFSTLSDAGSRLSAREMVIIQHLARRHSRYAIAQQLFISVNTLKSQLRSVYRKLEVSSAAAAVREAERRGLL